MNVLVVGGGAREHALCWKLAQSPLIEKLFCTPGNAGIAAVAQCLSGEPLEVARQIRADFVVVGPEVPLANGLIDQLLGAGIPAFGPNRKAAQIEGSKRFCKELLRRHNIPTAAFESFSDADAAKEYIRREYADGPVAVKYDGLAAGKGVVVAQSTDEALAAVDNLLHSPGDEVVIEECLFGEEVSLIALTDGESLLPLVPAQDHKRIGEGDTGPNTGGMGCYSPVPAFAELYQNAIETILIPTLNALKAEGIEYRGALYAGLMLTAEGPKVIEYNCRFGDPETEVILPRLKSDLLPLLLACAGHGERLLNLPCIWTEQAAVCVMMAAQGYPDGTLRQGDAIRGLEAAAATGALVFHAGTTRQGNDIVTNGGRVLGVTGLGDDFHQARQHAYDAVAHIRFEGAQFRRDIGWRCL